MDVPWCDIMETSSGYYIGTSNFNVQRTSIEDALRTSARDASWRYMEDQMGASTGRLLGMSLGRPWDIILLTAFTVILKNNRRVERKFLC